ncbi:MAG: exodeoxyribonuclease VII small subunit [Erysipelotrichaceae bacterium]|nr:exodeoxyribonuclease VII small subunit [Erysipelotrichaceae bacterium]
MAYQREMKRLEEIIALLEKNEIDLDEALNLYKEAKEITKTLTARLSEVEKEIKEIENI